MACAILVSTSFPEEQSTEGFTAAVIFKVWLFVALKRKKYNPTKAGQKVEYHILVVEQVQSQTLTTLENYGQRHEVWWTTMSLKFSEE